MKKLGLILLVFLCFCKIGFAHKTATAGTYKGIVVTHNVDTVKRFKFFHDLTKYDETHYTEANRLAVLNQKNIDAANDLIAFLKTKPTSLIAKIWRPLADQKFMEQTKSKYPKLSPAKREAFAKIAMKAWKPTAKQKNKFKRLAGSHLTKIADQLQEAITKYKAPLKTNVLALASEITKTMKEKLFDKAAIENYFWNAKTGTEAMLAMEAKNYFQNKKTELMNSTVVKKNRIKIDWIKGALKHKHNKFYKKFMVLTKNADSTKYTAKITLKFVQAVNEMVASDLLAFLKKGSTRFPFSLTNRLYNQLKAGTEAHKIDSKTIKWNGSTLSKMRKFAKEIEKILSSFDHELYVRFYKASQINFNGMHKVNLGNIAAYLTSGRYYKHYKDSI
jgi:hypothetical protein